MTSKDTETRHGTTGVASHGWVLYAAGETATSDAPVDRLAEHLDDDISLTAMAGSEAVAAAQAGPWSCLVVGDGIETAVTSVLLDAVACPTVLFTDTNRHRIEGSILDRVDTLVDAGDDRNVGFLASKIETLLSRSSNSLEDALDEALSTVETEVRDATALFLVDDSQVVWSSHDFETAFPAESVEGSVPDTEDFYARLDWILPAVTPDGRIVELDDASGSSGSQSLTIPAGTQSRYYHYDSFDIPAAGDGATLELFEDVTARVRNQARHQLLELLVEQAQDGLYTLDSNGVIDFCNESFAENLGHERAEIVGKHAAETLAPGELETGQRAVQYLLENPAVDSTEVDMLFETRSGERREMSIHFTLLPSENDTYNGLMGVVRDVTGRQQRERELRESRNRLQTVVENLPLVLFVLDSGGTITFADGAGMVGADWEVDDIVGLTVDSFSEDCPGVYREMSRALSGETFATLHEIDGRAYHTTYRAVHEGDELREVIGIAMNVTERREREREIEAQRDELSVLNRTNVLIQDIISALSAAASRDEIQEIVCNRLVESDRYALAWIGERRGANDRIVPLTTAGDATEYLDDIDVRTDESEVGIGPGGRAYRTGEVQVVSDIRETESFAPWREQALDAGFASVAAVPLCHGETTHGILCVYATEPGAFSARLEEGFAVLGETIGLALTAVQNKRLLQQDSIMELEFESTSEDACLVWLATACGCLLESAGAVETSDGVVQYIRVDGAEPGAVVEAYEAGQSVVDARITRSEGDSIIEIHVQSSLSVELSSVGARLESSLISPDGVSIVVEAPTDADVRAIQDIIEQWNPGAELVSKTERDQPHAGGDLASSLSTALTDRQAEVLRAAYLAGYYDWPRETTAEQLADSLGIASPTLHQHLRRAERNLLHHILDHS